LQNKQIETIFFKKLIFVDKKIKMNFDETLNLIKNFTGKKEIDIAEKVLSGQRLTISEGLFLFQEAELNYLSLLSTARKMQISENKVYLENVRVALLTFAQSNGYLPCPDTDTVMDGVENRTGGVCTSKNGKLPYKMLGVAQEDAWGEVVYYSVNNKADNTTAPLPIDDPVESASYFNNTSAPLFTMATEPVGVTKGGGNYSVCSENSTSEAFAPCGGI